MKRIAGVAILVTVLALSLVALAAAHTSKHRSAITFQETNNGTAADTFKGRVNSRNFRCVANRKVKIYRRVDGGADVFVDKVRTRAYGKYSSRAAEHTRAGRYYAVVTRRERLEIAAHTHVCRKATSRTG